MPQYMLLLHDDPSAQPTPSPEEIQAIVAEYQAWSETMASEGRMVGGEKLADDGGRELRLEGDDVLVTDGPFAEAREVLGGYFVIRADDDDAAVELARTCPHVRYGSRLTIRRIEELDDCGS